MEFNHLSFYVDAVAPWRKWFVEAWGATVVEDQSSAAERQLVWVGAVPILLVAQPAVTAAYLGQHPPGIGDVALRVNQVSATLERVVAAGGQVIQPVQVDPWGRGQWAQIQGWGALGHTLVESWQEALWVPGIAPAEMARAIAPAQDTPAQSPSGQSGQGINAIDHTVLNVPAGELTGAVDWYCQQLGFQPRQRFTIHTPRSGLRSLVLAHPQGGVKLPINEPVTDNSQVQEFLHYNRGCGIQHVALHTGDIVQTVAFLKERGVQFLSVPQSYYAALRDRPGYCPDREADLVRLQILVDWEPHLPQARLLQTFTQPLLDIPTMFFEIIQRQAVQQGRHLAQAQGFGERNFQALFEAIEQEQMKRDSLR